MSKTTVLFICPDNSLLGPLAESYLNFRAGGLMRAFSAGTQPAGRLNVHVTRLLAAVGADTRGLAPKPLDVFLMPHSVVPDRMIYLADMDPVPLPQPWKVTTSSHWWSVTRDYPEKESFGESAECFRRIRHSIDQLLKPPRAGAPDVRGPDMLGNVA